MALDIMTVYIAGKVSGENTDECREKFARKEKELRASGYNTFNPFKHIEQNNDIETITWAECMRVLIPKLCECQAICLLPDWHFSEGAKQEHEIAKIIELKVMY